MIPLHDDNPTELTPWLTVTFMVACVLVFWFVMQLLYSWLSGDQEGGVAFGAHIGGFIAGMVLISFFRYRNRPLHLFGRRY